MVSVGLITPVLKNFKGAVEMLASVDIPVELFIVDNWNMNRGVAAGWNEGIRRAWVKEMDVVIVSNDDIVYDAGTLDKLVASSVDYDLVTARNTRDGGEYVERFVKTPDYASFAIKPAEFIDKFGWFDENIKPAYFEDNDMARRIDVGGGTQVCRTDATMLHVGSVTQNMDGPVCTQQMFEDNRAYYREKWGGVPGEELYTAPHNGLLGHTYKEW